MEKTYSTQIAELLADLRYEQIPADVIEQVKRLTLHVLGVSVAAAPIDQTKRVISITQHKGGVEEATIWGSNGKKVPIEEAAFANGTIIDILDWEDCTWCGHATAAAVPVALAFAEAKERSGKDYILDMVTTYEGYTRIAMAAQPTRDYVNDGFRFPLVSVQIFAAAIAAAKAMGFDAREMEQVFGAATYNAIVPSNVHAKLESMSDIFHYAHGFCARNGVVSAVLTREGFDNCYGALDGGNGFWKMISDRHRTEWYTKDFGKDWYTNQVVIKHWPVNIWVEAPVDAMANIYARTPFKMEDVKAVRVTPPANILTANYAESSKAMLDAMFNIAYCCSVYLMSPDNPGAGWYTEEMRHNEKLVEFTKKFSYYGEPVITYDHFVKFMGTGEFPEVTVQVELNDGTVLSETLRYPKGHPRNNLTLEEVYNDFRMCCKPFIPADKIEAMIAMIDDLENVKSMRPFAEMLVIRAC